MVIVVPWVERERIRYSEDFKSQEEAEKWLEEHLKWFDEVEREMREFHRRIWSMFDRVFGEPLIERRHEESLMERIERLEKEIVEIKELLRSKYIKEKKPKYEATIV